MLLVQSGVTTSAPTAPSSDRRVRRPDRPLRSGTGRSRCGSRAPASSSAPIMPASVMPNVSRTCAPHCRASFSRLASDSGSAEQSTRLDRARREIEPARLGEIGEVQAVAAHAHPDGRLEPVDQFELHDRWRGGAGAGPVHGNAARSLPPAPASGRPDECRAETTHARCRRAGSACNRRCAQSRSSRLRCRR